MPEVLDCHSPSNRAASLSLIIFLINNHLLKSSTQTFMSLKTFGTKKTNESFHQEILRERKKFLISYNSQIQIKMTDDDSWSKSDSVVI